MPRRPRKQPRASNGTVGAKKSPRAVKKGDADMKKWVRSEDIEGDEEDNFHAARDRILLEGDDAEGDDSDDGEEEVFGLGLEDEDSEADAEDEQGLEPAVEEGDNDNLASRKRKKPKQSAPRSKSPSSDSDSEESDSWGRTKSAYYASNAALLSGKEGEEDEEEANEMEEREARRLQARMRDSMADEDYGLDDVAAGTMEDASLEVDDFAGAPKNSAVLPAPGVYLDKAAALRHLEKTSPETLALAREWDDVVQDLIRVQDRLDKLESTTPHALSLGLSHLHHQTLLTYVTTLAFYLHLRATVPVQASQPQSNTRLKPVLARLLTLKQALATMEELDFDASDDDEDEWESDASDLDEEGLAELGRLMRQEKHRLDDDMTEVWGKGRKRLDEGELEALLKDANAEVGSEERPKKRAKRAKHVEASQESHAVSNGIYGKQQLVPKLAFDLVEPDFVPTTRSTTRAVDDGLEAYGEVTALSVADDADKKSRKRTLRFHTSKIETSARRKEEARERMGGDDDIPYRERKKEKEARVRREVEKTRGVGGDDLDAEGDDTMRQSTSSLASGKRKRDAEESMEEQEGEDGYYELVKRTKQEKKDDKKRQYEDERNAERLDIEDNENTSGPRSLTRAILKNKGLTPRRSKSVRNPRVKKRERFEKAKKKVRSQRAVFKGGLAGKPYGGEESGITKVVKSVKF